MDHRLHLLRHAKSSWGDTGLTDEQRPLAPRGQRAAEALRRHFADSGFAVDLVLCSPARRTRETWSAVQDGVAGHPAVRFDAAIYGATRDDLLGVLRGVADTVSSVLVVGHNPGLEELAGTLTGGGEAAALARLREKYPAGALASFTLDCRWADLGPGAGQLDGFLRPRDLE